MTRRTAIDLARQRRLRRIRDKAIRAGLSSTETAAILLRLTPRTDRRPASAIRGARS